MAVNRTIVVRGRGIRKEAIAGGAITPGHLVKRNTSNQYVVHSTASGNASKTFAVENEVVGLGIAVAYVANDTCLVEAVQSGSEINALVAASASAVVIGDAVESAGDGTVRKHTPLAVNESGSTNHGSVYTDNIVGYALEAVDNSGGGSAVRLLIEIA